MSEEPGTKLRVFIADDHPLVLDGIRPLLNRDPGLELVGEALDGRIALRMTIELKPDVAVLDLSMPGLNGVDVTRKLLIECPNCKVIILTVHEDRSYFRKLIELGAAGYVLKRSMSEDLLRAIHSVAAGGTYLDPAIAGKAFDGIAGRPPGVAADHWVDLTERESEILRLIARGHSTKEVSNLVKLGVKSVEAYKARGMEKLGYNNRVQLVGYALAQDWLKDV